jgi:hypothetical protein
MGNSGRRKKKTNAEMPFAEKRSGEQRALSSEERGMRQGRGGACLAWGSECQTEMFTAPVVEEDEEEPVAEDKPSSEKSRCREA